MSVAPSRWLPCVVGTVLGVTLAVSLPDGSILQNGAPLGSTHLDFGRRAFVPTPAPHVGSGPLPAVANTSGAMLSPSEDGKSLAERLLDSERKEIVAAVEKSRGNIASAARMLGINRSTLYYRLRKHGLEHLLPTKVQVGGDEPAPGDPVT